jgi:hypothetical protein
LEGFNIAKAGAIGDTSAVCWLRVAVERPGGLEIVANSQGANVLDALPAVLIQEGKERASAGHRLSVLISAGK